MITEEMIMVEALRYTDDGGWQPGEHETWDELARCSVEHDDVKVPVPA